MTRTLLAGLVGCAVDTIDRAEHGKSIQLRYAWAIARVLDASLDDLFPPQVPEVAA